MNSVVGRLTFVYLFVYGCKRITGATILIKSSSLDTGYTYNHVVFSGNITASMVTHRVYKIFVYADPQLPMLSTVHLNSRRYIDILWLKGRTYGTETWCIDSIGVPHCFGKKKNDETAAYH